jgi:hypothetical protein
MCHFSDANEAKLNIFACSATTLQDEHFDCGHCTLAKLPLEAVSVTPVIFSLVSPVYPSYVS